MMSSGSAGMMLLLSRSKLGESSDLWKIDLTKLRCAKMLCAALKSLTKNCSQQTSNSAELQNVQKLLLCAASIFLHDCMLAQCIAGQDEDSFLASFNKIFDA